MGMIFNKTSSNILYPINKNVDGLISASNGLMCLKQTIFGASLNPATIMQGLAGYAAGMITAIVDAVTEVVMDRVNQMVDSVLSPLRKIRHIIDDITATLEDTQDLIDKATNMDNYFNSRQNCSSMAANLLDCLAKSAINKITNKVAMNVDKHLGKIADNVSKEALKVNGSIGGFVDRNTKFLDKANLQTKLLM